MATLKPDLTRVWANGAPPANVVDPDTTAPGKVNAGWQAEVPPFEHFNFLQKWFTQGLAHFNEQGIGVWDTDTTYPIGGLAKANNNRIYSSVIEQNGNDPTIDDGTNWIPFLAFSGGTVCFKDFGAVGDGVSDDTSAMQKALNSGFIVKPSPGRYLFTSDLSLPDGCVIKSTHDVVFVKRGNINIKNAAFPNYGSNIYIDGLNYTQEDNSVSNRGNMMHLFVDNIVISNIKIRNIALTDTIGAWSIFLSGKNVMVLNPDIDSTSGGIFADGIHCAYLENAVIAGGTINAGDDAIALYSPSITSAQPGRDALSKNIIISNLNLGSADANIVRIGAASIAETGNSAVANASYRDVIISDINDISVPDVGTSGRRITITDVRTPAEINPGALHTNITFSNVNSTVATSAGILKVQGNPDPTDVANIAQKNIGKIVFDNCKFLNGDNGANIIAGGLVELNLSNQSEFIRTSASAFKCVSLDQVNRFFVDSSVIQTGGVGVSGTTIPMNYVAFLKLIGATVIGNGEFAMLNIDTNPDQDTSIEIRGGFIGGAERLLTNNNAVDAVNVLKISDVDMEATITEINPNILNFNSGYVKKTKDLASGDGTTGGAGSAGAGNQYVEIEIRGVVYKVLHDGTV